MNKVTKGTLAAAAAGALLLGGVGTYARWTAGEEITAGNVVTGQLTLDSSETLGWSYDGETMLKDDPATPDVFEGPEIVPGDTISAVYAVKITAEGDRIAGSFELDGIAESLPGEVAVTIEPAASSGLTQTAGVWNFVEGEYSFDVTVKVAFPVTSETGQNGTIDFSQAQLVVKQQTA